MSVRCSFKQFSKYMYLRFLYRVLMFTTMFSLSFPSHFVGGSCFIHATCIYLRILVSNTVSISHIRDLTITDATFGSGIASLREHLNSTKFFVRFV